jgi:hypothetical protein
MSNKSKVEVLRLALKEGIKKIKKSNPASAKILLKIAGIGKKTRLRVPKMEL